MPGGETGCGTANRSATGRGFTIYDQFADSYGNETRIQQSSSAEAPRVWIFCGPSSAPASPHLDAEQAKRLRDALDAFIAEEP